MKATERVKEDSPAAPAIKDPKPGRVLREEAVMRRMVPQIKIADRQKPVEIDVVMVAMSEARLKIRARPAVVKVNPVVDDKSKEFNDSSDSK